MPERRTRQVRGSSGDGAGGRRGGGGARGRGVPLGVYLARRKHRKWTGWAAVTMLAAVMLGWSGGGERSAAALGRLERVELEVVAVVDAGRLQVRPTAEPATEPGRAVTVQLAGVDINGPWAAACERALHRQAAGRRVRLSWRDRLPREGGRAYVYLADGRLLNGWLIESGLARATDAATESGGHQLSAWFDRLEGRALRDERGFWPEFAGE